MSIAAVVLLVATGYTRGQVVIETVTVGNPGNADDTEGDGYGAVDYVYQIGTFEVTAGQYTEFLNAVADDDTYGLYNTSMWSSTYGCKIERTNSSPNYSYSVGVDWADRPVNYVSWGDAARFANWLHNAQPTGAQDLSTTEDGSYVLNGATSNAALLLIVREPDATWVIPSEDEWYKAAYHYNDGVTGNYYDYPTSSNSVPSNDLVEPTDPGNNATFNDGDHTIGSPYYRTEGGAHENSESPYGTFDQGGNVWDWNEAVIDSSRGSYGGSYDSLGYHLLAASRDSASPTFENQYHGFRVAEVSEPGPFCGDGTIEDSEECDDTNTDDGDGCSSSCTVEDGFFCQGEPSACFSSDIPAVSTWALAIMLLGLLVVGSVVIIQRPRAAA